jgi:2-polyprenyl-3-methyl-5-hydroxy-6-metoxy-1,4-benzoquinol methylase
VLQLENEEPNTSLDSVRVVANLKTMTKGKHLLDVGCGYGLFSLEARRRGFSVDAIEIASTERAIAEQILGFAPTPTTLEEFEPDRTFDAIILSQILEHAREPVKWIRKVRKLLSPGGVAAIALPNFGSFITDILKHRDPYVTPPTHLNYFSARNLIRIAEVNQLAVVKVETLTRVPKRAFTRQFGRLPGGVLHRAFSRTTPLFDLVKKGNMLNMYIRREE